MFEALREKSVMFSIGGTCSAYDKAEGLCLYSQNAPKSSGGSQASHINSLIQSACATTRNTFEQKSDRSDPELWCGSEKASGGYFN